MEKYSVDILLHNIFFYFCICWCQVWQLNILPGHKVHGYFSLNPQRWKMLQLSLCPQQLKLGSHGWLTTSPPFSPRSRRLPRASCSCGARCWRRGWRSRGGGRASAADTSPPHPTHAARTPTPPRPDQHWLLLFIELQKIHRFSQSRTRPLPGH